MSLPNRTYVPDMTAKVAKIPKVPAGVRVYFAAVNRCYELWKGQKYFMSFGKRLDDRAKRKITQHFSSVMTDQEFRRFEQNWEMKNKMMAEESRRSVAQECVRDLRKFADQGGRAAISFVRP